MTELNLVTLREYFEALLYERQTALAVALAAHRERDDAIERQA